MSDSGKLPFDFTPQILRYLAEIMELGASTDAAKRHKEIRLDAYIWNEQMLPRIERNNAEFWGYLDKIGAIEIGFPHNLKDKNREMIVHPKTDDRLAEPEWYLTVIRFRIRDLSKLKTFLTERNIHEDLLRFCSERAQREDPSRKSEFTISLDPEKGIFRIYKRKLLMYPHASGRSKIFQILEFLRTDSPATTQNLARQTKQQESSIRRAIDAFNENAPKKLKLPKNQPPIIKTGTLYELNDYYHFEQPHE
jgi:hypothetical protein